MNDPTAPTLAAARHRNYTPWAVHRAFNNRASERCRVISRRHIGRATLTECLYAANWHVPLHSHLTSQVCVLLDGLYMASWAGKAELCRRGDLVFHPPSVEHEDRLLDRRCRSLKIEWDGAEEGLDADGPRLLQRPRSRHLAGQICEGLTARNPDTPGMRDLLGRLAAEIRDEVAAFERSLSWIGSAQTFIRENYLRPIGLREVTQQVRHSQSAVSHGFRRHLGVSVGEMIRELRVQHAEHLLRDPRLRLAQIALASGFADQPHMTRLFRRIRGKTPRAYRRESDSGTPAAGPTTGAL